MHSAVLGVEGNEDDGIRVRDEGCVAGELGDSEQ